jgi:hypothetical protein
MYTYLEVLTDDRVDMNRLVKDLGGAVADILKSARLLLKRERERESKTSEKCLSLDSKLNQVNTKQEFRDPEGQKELRSLLPRCLLKTAR